MTLAKHGEIVEVMQDMELCDARSEKRILMRAGAYLYRERKFINHIAHEIELMGLGDDTNIEVFIFGDKIRTYFETQKIIATGERHPVFSS